jgi:D-glycero-alpha-D-manno-heptose 1-phosphate guanylyltransferase
VDLIILCGGIGSRIQSVAKGRQKCILPVNEVPFLSIVAQKYISSGLISRIILASGFQGSQISRDVIASSVDIDVIISTEEKPLGTGGAIKKIIQEHEVSTSLMIVNGDSLCGIGCVNFLNELNPANNPGIIIGAVMMEDTSRYGRLNVSEEMIVEKFSEKENTIQTPGYINCGIYVANREKLVNILAKKSSNVISFEYDIVPDFVNSCSAKAINIPGAFIDIGIPADYHAAHALLSGTI